MQHRDYQLADIIAIKTAWNQGHDYIMYVLGTGGGKTVSFVDITKSCVIKGKRVLILMHREELIAQAFMTLYNSKIFPGIIKGDVQTHYERSVQVGSVQTCVRRLKSLPTADVVIIDEAHHVTIDNGYSKILACYPNAQVLMVTATPYRLSGEGFERLHPYKPTKLIQGKQVPELQRDGWLVPYRYFIASIPDLKNVRVIKGDYMEEDLQKAMELAPLVESYTEHVAGKQGICFAVNVLHSKKTVEQYLRAGIPAEHLDASTPAAERSRIISDFRAGLIKVIVNVGIITEGADFPSCDFVQAARPTKSLSLAWQMFGRSTRPLPGVIDGLLTPEARRVAIAMSGKPAAYILDNAGLYLEHGMPDQLQDWDYHFIGRKKAKKPVTDELEMLVYVVEGEDGIRRRTTNPKEIEGMRLIEVTTHVRKKIVNLTSLKVFDKNYYMFCNMGRVKKPGYVALEKYFDYCRKNSILLIPEIWAYIERRLITEVHAKVAQIELSLGSPDSAVPDSRVKSEILRVKDKGISRSYFERIKSEYERENAAALVRAQMYAPSETN
jgi:superfamily II DNA or RNA helicase